MQRYNEAKRLDLSSAVSARDQATARDIWEDACKSREGQIELIEAGRDGDKTAINYIFMKLIRQISDVFWNNFLGPNQEIRKSRIDNGDEQVFISIVFECLMSDGKGSMTAPLHAFNPEKFDGKTDIINKLGYYVQKYLKHESIKYNRKEGNRGAVGKGGEDVNVSYSDYDYHANEDLQADGDQAENAADMSAWKQFVRDPELDEGKAPTTRDVLKAMLKDDMELNAPAVAKQYGVHPNSIRTRLQSVGDIMSKHGVDGRALMNLLQTVGAYTLEKDL